MRKAPQKNPAAALKPEEAQSIAQALCQDLTYDADSLGQFVLLLWWLANYADDTERENVYIQTESHAAAFINGVGEAIEAEMRRQLDALRRKGGAR